MLPPELVPVDTRNAYAFYNFYAGASENSSTSTTPFTIAQDQLRTVAASGLLERLDAIYYTVIGPGADIIRLHGSAKLHKVAAFESASEIETLHRLWQFCSTHPHAQTVYFHSKGSFRPNIHNTRLRKHLDCFVLNPNCLDALNEGYDTCGYRISPIPHLHHSGNAWAARCSHIAKLPDPRLYEQNSSFRNALHSLRDDLEIPDHCGNHSVGLERWFAETWVGMVPEFKPADCLPLKEGKFFSHGYDVPHSVRGLCPNMAQNWNRLWAKGGPSEPLAFGAKCGNASMLAHPEEFAFARRLLRSFPRCFDLTWTELRSQLLFGESATLMQRWRSAYGERRRVVVRKERH